MVYLTDGGGKVSAARKAVFGGQRVAEVMVRVGRQWKPDRIDLVEVGGELALKFYREGQDLVYLPRTRKRRRRS